MKWVIIIYLAIWTNTPDAVKHTRLEFPATDFQECIDIAEQINDIANRGHNSDVSLPRVSWVYNNMLDEIKAECVFEEPPPPASKWLEKKKRDRNKLSKLKMPE
jgi:hypothetical protein